MHLELMRVKDGELSEIQRPLSYKSAIIWHCKFKSLSPLSELRNLQSLVIATFPDASLDLLSGLCSLRYLKIVHIPKVTNLSALENMGSLEYLSLSTLPSWDASGKTTVIDSLLPISKLKNLKGIELFGVCTSDKGLSDLEQCSNLQTAKFSKYPKYHVDGFINKMGVSEEFIPEPVWAL